MTPCRFTNVFVVTLLGCSGAKTTKSSDAGVNDDQARQHRFAEAILSPLEYLTDGSAPEYLGRTRNPNGRQFLGALV
jgi:hypothetical protein